MTDETKTKDVRNDEIDLLDLFRRMGKGIARMLTAIWHGILFSIVFLLRRWLPLGLSLVVGIGLSYIMKITSDEVYTSDMVMRNNAGSVSDMIAYVNRLSTYCREQNFQAIQEALSIKPEETMNIVDISAFWVIDKRRDEVPDFVDYRNKHNVYDTLDARMKDRFDIRVRIKQPQQLYTVRDGIIGYFNSDSLFQQRNKVRIRQNHELFTRLNYDISQLDSLQKVKYFEETRNKLPQTGGQIVFMQPTTTQLLYTDIYTLYNRKQDLEYQKDIYKDIVTVLSDFSIPTRRENGTMFYAKTYVPIVFLLTLLFLILYANRDKLKEIYKKY